MLFCLVRQFEAMAPGFLAHCAHRCGVGGGSHGAVGLLRKSLKKPLTPGKWTFRIKRKECSTEKLRPRSIQQPRVRGL